MCGIHGAFALHPKAIVSKSRLAHIAISMESRGKDATGIIWQVRNTGGQLYLKEANRARDCAWRMIMEQMPQSDTILSVLGHSRAQTHGSAKVEANNHPHFAEYQGGKVVSIVHNGTVSNYKEIAKRNEVQLTTDCDSEIFAALFAKFAETMEPLKALEKILGEVDGGAVLYMTPDGIGMHRRSGNPLMIGFYGGVTYLSSEEDYLKAVGCTNIGSIAENIPVWFANEGNTHFKQAVFGEKIERKYTPVVVTNHHRHSRWTGDDSYDKEWFELRLKTWGNDNRKALWGRVEKLFPNLLVMENDIHGDVFTFMVPADKKKPSAIYEWLPQSQMYHKMWTDEALKYLNAYNKTTLAADDEKEDAIIHASLVPIQ